MDCRDRLTFVSIVTPYADSHHLSAQVASTNLDNVIGCLPNHDIKKSTKVYIAPVAKADPAAEAE